MPLYDYQCENCGAAAERYTPRELQDVRCGGCGRVMTRLNFTGARAKTGVFPFVTPHIDADGRPMVIEDLGHLRRVEREYGVTLTAFSQNPSNPAHIQDAPNYRGWEIRDRERRR